MTVKSNRLGFKLTNNGMVCHCSMCHCSKVRWRGSTLEKCHHQRNSEYLFIPDSASSTSQRTFPSCFLIGRLDPSTTRLTCPMSDFLKKGLHKVSKAARSSVSRNVTPSTSTSGPTEQHYAQIEKIDWALEIAQIMKEISDGSPLLAPLKATCALIIRGLEVARVRFSFTTY